MAVILETSLGDITVDLYTEDRPICSKNFLKLCKIKYYNFCLFHSVQRNLVAQSGDPTGTGKGGHSVYEKLYGGQAAYFEAEVKPRIKHKKRGTVSMVNNGSNMHGSQFFITLAEDLDYLDGVHTVFGEVSEGFDALDKINEAYCDKEHRPYRDIRIFHTVVLDDPYDDPKGLSAFVPDRSPEPTKEQLKSDRIGVDEEIDEFEGKSHEEIEEILADREAKANAQILEMVGDIPDQDVKPPDNVLFVCKLNPVTSDEDLEVIFSRFGTIVSCEVIRDHKTKESLQYAFIEFEKPEQCEAAYFKMDNVLIDDRRIHVDFSQSVSKVKWKGKGKGVEYQKQSKEEEEDRPDYIIKDRTRESRGYDLVFSDDEKEEPSKKHKKKKKKARVSDSEDRKSRSSPDRKKKKKRSRSPSYERDHHQKGKNRHHSRSRSKSSDRDQHRRDKQREKHSHREYSRKDRDNRDKDKYRDKTYREDRERGREKEKHRHKVRHRDRSRS